MFFGIDLSILFIGDGFFFSFSTPCLVLLLWVLTCFDHSDGGGISNRRSDCAGKTAVPDRQFTWFK